MAFNLQTFKTRALTAIIFVAVMLAGIFINQWSFLLLFTIIHFGCWVEYQQLLGKINTSYAGLPATHKYSSMIGGWGLMLWVGGGFYIIGNISLSQTGCWIFILLTALWLLFELFIHKPFDFKRIQYSLCGLLYLSLSFGLLLNLYEMGQINIKGLQLNSGWLFPVVLIASIWINDTMAYIVGSFIGKTPFSKISPKKTWEGTIGGAILAIVVVTTIGHFAFGIPEWWSLAAISAIAAIAGTAGDLLESKLKRMAGVKDSGTLMPGHGGFLDRFDSLIFAIPFVWLYLKISSCY